MEDLPLLDITLLRLKNRQESLRAVASGAGVEFEWLAKFGQGRIADPGVRKVQKVHDYLSKKQ